MAFTTRGKPIISAGGLDKRSYVPLYWDSSFRRRITIRDKVAPNGGFGWVVVFAAFVVSFIISGFMKSFSAFRTSIFAEFPDTSPSEAAWISGLIGTLSLVTSPITGMLMTVYGFRMLVLVGGLLCSFGLAISYFATSASFLIGSLGTFVGIGASLAFTSSVVCVGKYFHTKRPAAMAIALSGGCVGAMVLPTGIGAILQALGLYYTFLVLSCMFSLICVCSIVFGPPEEHFITVCTDIDARLVPQVRTVFDARVVSDVKSENAGSSRLSRFAKAASEKLALKFLSDSSFLITALTIFAMGMGNPHFLHYIPQQAEKLGASHGQAMALLAYAAVGDLGARLSYGLLSSRSPFPRTAEYTAALIVSAIAVTLIPFCTAYGHFVAVSIAAGLGTGVWTIIVPLLLGANHGPENLNGTFALARLFQGVANLIYPSVAGKLRAVFGTEAVLLFMGGMIGTAAVLSISKHLCSLIRNRKRC